MLQRNVSSYLDNVLHSGLEFLHLLHSHGIRLVFWNLLVPWPPNGNELSTELVPELVPESFNGTLCMEFVPESFKGSLCVDPVPESSYCSKLSNRSLCMELIHEIY